ncbi:hypothetical protein NK718_01705 [Alsobacter sp. SYSU M60028]|uniref:Lipoprotein n=1 Tax=Alsobacter ponti TaxID=2962936 RepID=A0ABT1L909_9HYPH|nr:hypothetical protein [Alsobacter ponti]MCP8937220.1 hypothetical protein [Alsobacter ponti]
MPRPPLFAAALLPLLATLAACNTAAPQASAPQPASSYAGLAPGVSPAGFHLPSGSGCAADVARWKALQDNDLNSGHVNQKVYDQIQGEIAQASSACAAGRSAEASAMVRASRARHGYPQG